MPMLKLLYTPELQVNSHDLGIEVTAEAVRVPLELRTALEGMGVRNAESLAAMLQGFPTAIARVTGLDLQSSQAAITGALALLQPHVDSRVLMAKFPERRGMGAMPPRSAKIVR